MSRIGPGRGSESSPFETLVFVGLALVLAAAGCLWAAAQLSARLFSGSWLPLDLADMAGVVGAISGHAARPAAAFPPDAAALLPGPVPFWGTLAVLLVVPGVLAVLLLLRPSKPKRGRDEPEPARLATRRDLRPLLVDRVEAGRLVLGRARGRLVATEPLQAVIVLAPQRTGKSSGIAIPALLEHDGPVIATSIRTDLVEATLARRRRLGTTWIYEPTRQLAGGYPTAGWDPLHSCGTWQGALRMATRLCEAGQQGAAMHDGAFWSATAAKLLAPLLYAAAVSDRTMAEVVRWVDRQEEREVRLELDLAGEPAALDAAEASWAREERIRSSAFTTAEVALRAFADPAVGASTELGEITAERLYDGGSHTLYVCAPNHEQDRLRPLFSGLLGQLIAAAYDRHAAGAPIAKPLLLLLDEAANIAPLADLDTLASTAAGTEIQLVSIWQDLAQIQARYHQRAATVVNNHRAKLVLSGISDQPTLDYISRLAGDTEVARQSNSTDRDGRRSTTDSTDHRPLTPADTLRRLPPGHGLVLYGHLPPARIELRQWFNDKPLRRLAGGAMPPPPPSREPSSMAVPTGGLENDGGTLPCSGAVEQAGGPPPESSAAPSPVYHAPPWQKTQRETG